MSKMLKNEYTSGNEYSSIFTALPLYNRAIWEETYISNLNFTYNTQISERKPTF